jgi:hypothetical protein
VAAPAEPSIIGSRWIQPILPSASSVPSVPPFRGFYDINRLWPAASLQRLYEVTGLVEAKSPKPDPPLTPWHRVVLELVGDCGSGRHHTPVSERPGELVFRLPERRRRPAVGFAAATRFAASAVARRMYERTTS